MSLDEAWELVSAFHQSAGQPVRDDPNQLDGTRAAIRSAWMREEIEEFELARDLAEQVDALLDLLYFALGTLVEMGVKPAAVFDIVHNANMLKAAGTARDPQGKVLKPPGWRDPGPELRAALERQQAQSPE